MDFGILLPATYTPNELIEIAQHVENLGFSSFWYPDEKFFRDCYIGLTLVACNTSRINIGPCVTDPYSRHPIMTASAIASLAEIAPQRTWLGLGAGGRGFHAMGIQRQKPAIALREAVLIIKRLLAGESVDFQGEVIQLSDRKLDFSTPEKVPILIATGYGKIIQTLAGEIADGAMLANFASKETIESGISRIKTGLKKGNRAREDIRVISRINVAVNVDADIARKAVAPKILSAIRASYPSLTYFDDLPEFNLSSRFLSILKLKDYQSRTYYANPENSIHLIPPELYKHFSVVGTPDEIIDQFRKILSMKVFDEITILPVPSGDQSIIECISQIKILTKS